MRNDDATLEWVRGRLREARHTLIELTEHAAGARKQRLTQLAELALSAEWEAQAIVREHPVGVSSGEPGQETRGVFGVLVRPPSDPDAKAVLDALGRLVGEPDLDAPIPYRLVVGQ